jgi:hypothetical protein
MATILRITKLDSPVANLVGLHQVALKPMWRQKVSPVLNDVVVPKPKLHPLNNNDSFIL